MVNPLIALAQRPLRRRQNARRLAVTSPSGIREQGYVPLGGIDQWVGIRGQDRANPALVLLHGGPGSPYTAFNPHLSDWERHFTVVQWDQRGSGKTFERSGRTPEGRPSLERLVADGIELSQYVGRRLEQGKVVLLGSSTGSVIGMLMAARRPDLFHAYVGANQNSPHGDRESYRLTRDRALARRDHRGLRLLDAMGPEPGRWTAEQFQSLAKLAIRLGDDVPDMVHDLMLPALMFSPDYTMRDLKNLRSGMGLSLSALFAELVSVDLTHLGEIPIPVSFVMGEGDIITPVSSARHFLTQLRAPAKHLTTVPRAGHLVEFSHPRETLTHLLEHAAPADTARSSGAIR
jgi:pimeloyl-ACP methyl ester carboxylesterase